ncbi:MAG TPA: response regulator [Ktedonobacterales bacterium]
MTNLRALIVDDDSGIRETLSYALEDVGFSVLEAGDGAEALDVLRAIPDRMVVLLDILMPKLDGLSVLDAVAQDRQLAQRHAYILLTASPQTLPNNLADTYSGLTVAALSKPFSLDTLQEIMLDTLQRLPVVSQ